MLAQVLTLAQTNIQPPYPASEFITAVHFAPDSTIRRLAQGSDNWPVSWSQDDRLYTTFGDGWGFTPKVEQKLGLGFAKIEGQPPNVKGANIRPADENLGVHGGRFIIRPIGMLGQGNLPLFPVSG